MFPFKPIFLTMKLYRIHEGKAYPDGSTLSDSRRVAHRVEGLVLSRWVELVETLSKG